MVSYREVPGSSNQVTDLTALTELYQLEELNLNANEISDITPLGFLPETLKHCLFTIIL
jgi:Leucine-rich repeat (LRR) protein